MSINDQNNTDAATSSSDDYNPRVTGKKYKTGQVVIVCPYCCKKHYHGRLNDTEDPGWRAPHCTDSNWKLRPNYYIRKGWK